MNSQKKNYAGYNDSEYIMEEVRLLAAKIKNTEDYLNYQRVLKNLQENPELMAEFNEFRKKSLELQIMNSTDLYSKIDALQTTYKNILMDPVVTDFLTAEQRVNKMLRKIHNCLSANVPIDVSYME